MNKEILMVVDMVSNEKGVSKDIIFEALESALVSATRKKYRQGHEMDILVKIDRESGDYGTSRRWEVVTDEVYCEPERHLIVEDIQDKYPGAQVDDVIEEPMESIAFGRIAAQTARQVIVQKVREAERAQIAEAYRDRVGELINGVIKRIEKGNVTLDLGGNAEAIIMRENLIAREAVRPGDRIRAYLREVRDDPRGPQLILSRVDPEFLIELFKLEVPEIGENYVEVLSAARDPGLRAKIAVRAHDPRIDPVGACVGMRGSRVQAVTNELNGERIDIILWDENTAKFVVNAMSPAEVVSIIIDEDAHSIDVAVAEDQLSLAIGKGGQNVKLASQLTGWTLNVMTASEAEAKQEAETRTLIDKFMHSLDVDEEVAVILVQEGFSSIEEVAYVPINEMLEIEEFDEDIVEELRNRAKDALANKDSSNAEPAEDLLNMEGMDIVLAHSLSRIGVITMEDLAEQAVDDLLEVEGMNETRAAELIMTARAPWFENEDAESA